MLKSSYVVSGKKGEHLEIIKLNKDVHKYILDLISK